MNDRFATPQTINQTITSQPNGIGDWKPANSIRNIEGSLGFNLIEISGNTLKIVSGTSVQLTYTIPATVDLSNQEAFVFIMLLPFPNSFKIFMRLEDNNGNEMVFNKNNIFPAFAQTAEIKLSDFEPFGPVNLSAIQSIEIIFTKNDTNFALIIAAFVTKPKTNLINSCGY